MYELIVTLCIVVGPTYHGDSILHSCEMQETRSKPFISLTRCLHAKQDADQAALGFTHPIFFEAHCHLITKKPGRAR